MSVRTMSIVAVIAAAALGVWVIIGQQTPADGEQTAPSAAAGESRGTVPALPTRPGVEPEALVAGDSIVPEAHRAAAPRPFTGVGEAVSFGGRVIDQSGSPVAGADAWFVPSGLTP